MDMSHEQETVTTLVIGGGQAGLSVGYHLGRAGVEFVILDAEERVGDAWRHRWDSLRLFTPARFDTLDGMPFPAPPGYFPTKEEMADYLQSYAERFELPVRTGSRVTRLGRGPGGRFVVETGGRSYEAENVIVAMSDDQKPSVPDFAGELSPDIVQMHSSSYRNPSQLRDGPVLLVGAANSGADIAMELAADRHVWLSGREVGHVPFRVERSFAQLVLVPFVLRVVFHRILSVRTPMGRRARPDTLRHGIPLVRVKPKDLARAGVERVPRTIAVRDGSPVVEGDRVLEPANVIWCTGYHGGFDWIDLPVMGELGPRHRSGVVEEEPGLYFVGLNFLHAKSSSMVHGVGRDAERIAAIVADRATRTPTPQLASA